MLLVSAPDLGNYISGAILFRGDTLPNNSRGQEDSGRRDVLASQNIVPGIKVDKGLLPLAGSNDETWCRGLDVWRLARLRTNSKAHGLPNGKLIISIPNGPSVLAVKEAASLPYHKTLEVAEKVWAEVFYYLAENNVMFEGILLKPSCMVTPGAE
ncbi:hypothetical protein J5N97_019029 [Dioscorea zingiberensis]|uniref:Fructose-bisphosphate aldolase n=1 Tax=Dioscorea zingiberensis TaxID=325984 RepID=A0A9D5HCA6_9LILI|nr:hypothetical protein J5N97_019029 [Dioscorea zingiberensis]